jgi:hypothetical protein
MGKFLYNLITILFGFFLSTLISTLLSQTGDWSILSASILVAFVEMINKNKYGKKRSSSYWFLLNNLKIGFMYGLFVEAFKLGS